MPNDEQRPFQDLRVVEIAGSVAGAYAGKLFADYGAAVLLVDPPGGSERRAHAPFVAGVGSVFAYTNTGKRSRVIDRATAAGQAELGELLRGADVIIESSSPDPLAPVSRGPGLDHTVRVYLSPFGLDGPFAGYRSTPFTDFANGGHMFMTGDTNREPLQGPPEESAYAAGAHGFIAAMAGLIARRHTGRGQEADISHMEVMASLHQYTTIMWTHGHHIQGRVGNRQPGPWHPNGHLPCKGGYVSINAPGRERLTRTLAIMGLIDLLEEPRFATDPEFLEHRDDFDAAVAPWLMEHTADEVMDLLQEVRVPCAPVRTLQGVLGYEHLRVRDFWRRIAMGEAVYEVPRGPFTISGHPTGMRAAPALDDADAAFIARFREAPPPPAPKAGEQLPNGPLSRVRILDLTAGWAGPLAGRILGDLGADMVRIEPPWARGPRQVPKEVALSIHMYPDNEPGEHPWNRNGMTNKLGRNRRAISLRMDLPEGKAVAEELIRWADVVLENFTPRVMPNLGFDFESLRRINPSIVYVHLPGFGADGPHAHHAALGPMIEAAAGSCALMGYPGGGPQRQGMAFPDAISGIHGPAGTLIGLWDVLNDPERRAREIEGAQVEATVCFNGDAILAVQETHEEPAFTGNRHPRYAPQGVYPCAGEERWIAISVTDDRAWQGLSTAAGLPTEVHGWDADVRRAHHDALDSAIAAWTRTGEMHRLMDLLQAHGVAAAAVIDSRGMVEDRHLNARGFFPVLEHPEWGRFPFPGLPIHFSDTPATYRIPGPALGQYNDAVLGGTLGLPAERLAALRAGGVLHDGPADPV